jgi:SM-20-related protein
MHQNLSIRTVTVLTVPGMDAPYSRHKLQYTFYTVYGHTLSKVGVNIKIIHRIISFHTSFINMAPQYSLQTWGVFLLIALVSIDTTTSFSVPSSPGRSSLVSHQFRSSTSFLAMASSALPRISSSNLQELTSKGYVIIDKFLPNDLQKSLRKDVQDLRDTSNFNIAKIGQDSTNALNIDIRVAETCFIGSNKLFDNPNEARSSLYQILDYIRQDLPGPLDTNLSEFLYAYYPTGGFYRRHRDAISGSASTLRQYSLLLYLNKGWTETDGGRLRLHMDSGGDSLPESEEPNFQDVDPNGGTLVLFESDKFPHEVLDTKAERVAVVGWYNRPVTADDIAELSGGAVDPMRLAALAIAAGLMTVGVLNILNS